MFGEITGQQLIEAVLALKIKPHPCPTCDILIVGRCVICDRERRGIRNHFGFVVREASTFDTTVGPWNDFARMGAPIRGSQLRPII